MNKQELIGTLADQTGLGRAEAAGALDAMLGAIVTALREGEEVRIVNFGTFSVSRRKSSTGRNPRTGEPMTIAATSQPKFRPGRALKAAVN